MQSADLYLRLSFNFEGATSISRQESDCRRWCAAHGLTVRRVHVDRGVSGYSTAAHRDGFDAALAAVVDGEVATLVVWKLDRLSRRGIGQVGALLDDFERAGGRLVSVQDQLDTAQPQARVIVALLCEFARAESETMGVRIKSAKEAQRAAGLWLSGKPPYGYAMAADRRLVPVEPAASVMREVFAMVLAGYSLAEICRRLNARGLRNSRGHPWTTTVLSESIKTPAYAGLTPVRHVTAQGRHAGGRPAVYRDRDTGLEVSCLAAGARPIVSRARQLAAFAALDTRRPPYGLGTLPLHPANALLVRGLGRCAGCNQFITVCGSSYRCARFDHAGDRVCFEPVSAMVTAVDRHVTADWFSLIASHTPEVEALRQAVTARWAQAPPRPAGDARVRAELDDLRVRLEDADTARYVRGDLDTDRHTNVVRKLTRRINILVSALTGDQPDIDTSQLDDADYVASRWNLEAPDGRRFLLRLGWSRVTLAKAARRCERFDPARITYAPAAAESFSA